MKKGTKTTIKILTAGLLAIVLCVAFASGVFASVSAATNPVVGEYKTFDGVKYSAVHTDGIILNVEKVSAGSDYTMQHSNIAENTPEAIAASKYEFKREGEAIQNNGYVWLDGAQSFIISIGQYYLAADNKTVMYADNSVGLDRKIDPNDCAGINDLHVAVKHYKTNAAEPTEIGKDLRELSPSGGSLASRYDYALKIDNASDVDGYYLVEYTYRRVGNDEHTEGRFGFFVVRKETYATNIEENGESFSVSPTLTAGAIQYHSISGDNNRYYIGNGDEQYPTLTFDCTKIGFKYHHTTNGLRSDYEYIYSNGTITVIKSRNNKEISRFTYDEIGRAGLKNNIINIVFTEVGDYTFEFNYKYVGITMSGVDAPEIKERISSINLTIHGYELAFARADADSAEMRHYTIAASNNNGNDQAINTIFANGYNTEWTDVAISNYIQFSEGKMGVAYTPVVDTRKVGSIIERIDALKSNKITKKTGTGPEYLDNFVLPNASEYVKTNQGYLKLVTNDTFLSGTITGTTAGSQEQYESYYFYTDKYCADDEQPFDSLTDNGFTEITNIDSDMFAKYRTEGILWYSDNNGATKTRVTNQAFNPAYKYYESNKKPFSNLTSFTKKGGYYLLVLHVDTKDAIDGNNYYQVFAFRYMSDDVNVELKTYDTNRKLASNDYTNENIKVEWTKPGVFDKKISVAYTKVVNSTPSEAELKQLALTDVRASEDGKKMTATIGADVAKGSFAKYLFKASNTTGDSATYTIATIDRQDIQDVHAYLVETFTTTVKNYNVVRDNSGNPVITNGLVSGLATMGWSDKKSGARIRASYRYAPFNANVQPVSEVTIPSLDLKGIYNGYTIGATSNNEYIITNNYDYNVLSASNVLSGQGVYIIDLIDEAGNTYRYGLIIDNSPAYFKVDNTKFATRDTLTFTKNEVDITVGDFKAIYLGDLAEDNIVYNMLKGVAEAKVDNSNELFSSGATVNKVGANYILAVRNYNIYEYSEGKKKGDFNGKLTGKIVKNEDDVIMSRRVYAYSANQRYSVDVSGFISSWLEPNKSKSFVDIIINTDRSSLMLFYSDKYADESILDVGYKGNSEYHYMQQGTSKTDAPASGLNFASFSIILSVVSDNVEEAFEVSQITYSYYERVNGNYSTIPTHENVVIFDRTSNTLNGAVIKGERLYLTFGDEFGTPEGYYVITRKYTEGQVPPNDKPVLQYHFIVDKTAIIEKTEAESQGEGVALKLLENENYIQMYNYTGTYFSTKQEIKTSDVNIPYTRYVYTNKVPAVMDVPQYKFYDWDIDTHEISRASTDYKAGTLTLEIYYVDLYCQVDHSLAGRPLLIYSGEAPYKEGISSLLFDNKIYTFLRNNPKYNRAVDGVGQLSDLFNANNQNWTYLIGDYVYVIKDMVKIGKVANAEVDTTNNQVVAYNISQDLAKTPEEKVYVGADENALSEATVRLNPYHIVTNQEFIRIYLDDYNENLEVAMIDNSYIEIRGYLADRSVSYTYTGAAIAGNDPYLIYDDINHRIIVNLPTGLKDEDGNLLIDNFSKTTQYDITLRYKISDGSNANKYENCYIVYDKNGKATNYAKSTYHIDVDRLAPTKDINKLKAEDKLLTTYLQAFGETTLNSNCAIGTTDYVFANRYTKYYDNLSNLDRAKYIYTFVIKSGFEFDTSDNTSIYYREMSVGDFNNVTLNSAVEGTFAKWPVAAGGTPIKSGSYYEIIEKDIVGNTTQYFVFVDDTPDNFTATFSADGQNYSLDQISSKAIFSLEGIDLNTKRAIYRLVLSKIVSLDTNMAYTEPKLELITTIWDKSDSFETVTSSIMRQINDIGNYTLTVYGQDSDRAIASANINRYNKNSIPPIDVDALIENGVVYLEKAIYQKDTTVFYATQITIKQGQTTEVFTCVLREGVGWIYVDSNGDRKQYKQLDAGVTYQIIAISLSGQSYYAWYNSTGSTFYKIKFASQNGYLGYYEEAGTNYYSILNADIEFDQTLFPSYRLDGNTYASTEDGIGLTVDEGQSRTYKVELLWENEEGDLEVTKTYNVTIDKRAVSGTISLVDLMTGEDKASSITNPLRNIKDYRSAGFKIDQYSSGDKTLSWNVLYNDYFDYGYTIVKEKVDGGYETIDNSQYTAQGRYHIRPDDKYNDVLWFVVNVMPKGKTNVIGNIVYAMKVTAKSNYYYTVSIDGRDITSNSTFTTGEVNTVSFKTINGLLGGAVSKTEEYGNIPLYVVNQEPKIAWSSDHELTKYGEWTDFEGERYHRLEVYYVQAAESQWGQAFGIYIVKDSQSSDLLDPVEGGGLVIKDTKQLANSEYTGYGINSAITPVDYTPVLEIQSKTLFADFAKNPIVVSYYYLDSDNVITRVLDRGGDGIFSFTIEGVGPYTIKISDLAGNVHPVLGNEEFVVNVLTEVPITVNGEAYSEDAYYDSEVKVDLIGAADFETTSIVVNAKLNGKVVTITDPVHFAVSDSGNYEISIEAKVRDNVFSGNTEPVVLKRKLKFTILNPKEASEIIDITPIKKYIINSIIDEDGQDFTEVFNDLMEEKSVGSVKYTDLLDKVLHTTDYGPLELKSGMHRFTINYTVRDNKYPDRTISASFAMNDQKPTITCSLAPGESTKKAFTISFNPGVIYTQIGESQVVINGQTVYTIDENAPDQIVEREISFKEHGADDYQIVLASKSGIIKSSYIVTIKAPLNTSAIIIIVVVSAVVVGVVVAIIVLRRKMRIR